MMGLWSFGIIVYIVNVIVVNFKVNVVNDSYMIYEEICLIFFSKSYFFYESYNI